MILLLSTLIGNGKRSLPSVSIAAPRCTAQFISYLGNTLNLVVHLLGHFFSFWVVTRPEVLLQSSQLPSLDESCFMRSSVFSTLYGNVVCRTDTSLSKFMNLLLLTKYSDFLCTVSLSSFSNSFLRFSWILNFVGDFLMWAIFAYYFIHRTRRPLTCALFN